MRKRVADLSGKPKPRTAGFVVLGHPVGDVIPAIGTKVRFYLGGRVDDGKEAQSFFERRRETKIFECAVAGVKLEPVGPFEYSRHEEGLTPFNIAAQWFLVVALNQEKFMDFGAEFWRHQALFILCGHMRSPTRHPTMI